jgi:hypothetical protein
MFLQSQKGKPCEMDLSFLKNDITNILGPQKPVIYSRNLHKKVKKSRAIADSA